MGFRTHPPPHAPESNILMEENPMELKVSSPNVGGLSPPDCASDPEEKEFSEDDDDDRNHKHRRRETRSQSLERDTMDQVFSRPYRKRNKPFENGHPFRESDSQSTDFWKNYNTAPNDRDFTKFDKRRLGSGTFSRAPLDANQKMWVNQSFSAEASLGRGRGRELASRFNSVDLASQMVQQGSIPSTLFPARALPHASNAQSASWGTFGLIPGIPNGGIDTLHSLGLQGSLGPAINPSLNVGISRQRCRDFEERGFCLRGDLCPMEHGVNRIVIEDVQVSDLLSSFIVDQFKSLQGKPIDDPEVSVKWSIQESLSQFNLPNPHLLSTGAIPSVTGPSGTLVNSKGFHSKSGKPGMIDDMLGLNGLPSNLSGTGGADLYDPDQPLWNNDDPESSAAILGLHSPKTDQPESLLHNDFSDPQQGKLSEKTGSERPLRSSGTVVGSQSTSSSVWGRIGSYKDRSEVKGKFDPIVNLTGYPENETREEIETNTNVQGIGRQGKRIAEDYGHKSVDPPSKVSSDTGRNIRKPSQKAQRTLFVNGIPLKNNKKESLLSHFRKFGEIIDVYIPSNSERAFVQFSKREEAEAALMSPEAVMGNRFIKLWWANRDSIPDDGTTTGHNSSVTSLGLVGPSVQPQPVAPKVKENLQPAAPKVSFSNTLDAPVPSDHPKPVAANGPKPQPPLQKKLELEMLKEELRKKQEMLDQKRNDFRRQLDKLQKLAILKIWFLQVAGLKNDAVSEQASKRHKADKASEGSNPATPRPNDPGTVMASSGADSNKSVENALTDSSGKNFLPKLQDGSSLKQPRPLAPAGAPFMMHRFKLDNRPTSFRITSPLPDGFADLAVMKEHFSPYGDLSAVELEDGETHDGTNGSEVSKSCSACIAFTTRHAAEKAFANAKYWHGSNLQFTWLMPSNSSNDRCSRESLSYTPRTTKDFEDPAGKSTSSVSQEGSASGNGEPVNSGMETGGGENVESTGESESGLILPVSSENQSSHSDI
ncbi:RNA recognition motif domain [Dillenia turbinata]|uniref:RNA recognition motif domain n=1 Tax=Dillenia turbinata TaxID=194707 RepID=A0AAN8UN80_9MAGN